MRFVLGVLVVAATLATVACRKADSPVSERPRVPLYVVVPNPCESDDPLSHCDKSDPVLCGVDSECEAPNCGPCASGDVITHRDLALDCTVSVCAPLTVCAPEHVCKVR